MFGLRGDEIFLLVFKLHSFLPLQILPKGERENKNHLESVWFTKEERGDEGGEERFCSPPL